MKTLLLLLALPLSSCAFGRFKDEENVRRQWREYDALKPSQPWLSEPRAI